MRAPGIKHKSALILLVSLVGLCGCAHQYLMKLSNGDQIISYSKPKLQESRYHFTGETGEPYVIPQNRVVKNRNHISRKGGEKAVFPGDAEETQALVFSVAGLNYV